MPQHDVVESAISDAFDMGYSAGRAASRDEIVRYMHLIRRNLRMERDALSPRRNPLKRLAITGSITAIDTMIEEVGRFGRKKDG